MTPFDNFEKRNALESKRHSLFRGFGLALLFAMVGFAIPFSLGLIEWLAGYVNSPFQNPDPLNWLSMVGKYGTASIGIGLILFLAAALNYTPGYRLGMLRATLVVGVYAIVGIFVAGWITHAFAFNRKSDGAIPGAWIPWALMILFPVGCTAIHGLFVCSSPKK